MTGGPVDSPARPGSTMRAALEVLVYAPLGLGVSVVSDAPATAKRVRQELNNARFIGRLTIKQGASQLRQRLDSSSGSSAPKDVDVATDGDTDRDAGSVPRGNPLDVGDLALPDYDQLPAIDIVAKLAQLSAEERSIIEAYETANRQRRTVLGKLAQLSAVE
jgi:hypothetical protein